MTVRNFNESEKQKLMQIIKEGSTVLGEIDDLRGGLRDTVIAIAEEMELKPAIINKAINVASSAFPLHHHTIFVNQPVCPT